MNRKTDYQNKIKSRDELVIVAQKIRLQGKKIVMTGGIFDVLHPGHTRYLQKAKKLGDILIVVVNSDDSTRRNKGPKRPINNQEIRMEIIASLESVDYVTIFNELTPKEIITEVKPHIWVKGGQYKSGEMPEAPVIRKYGGKIRILPLEKGFSVSDLVKKILKEEPIKSYQKESSAR